MTPYIKALFKINIKKTHSALLSHLVQVGHLQCFSDIGSQIFPPLPPRLLCVWPLVCNFMVQEGKGGMRREGGSRGGVEKGGSSEEGGLHLVKL